MKVSRILLPLFPGLILPIAADDAAFSAAVGKLMPTPRSAEMKQATPAAAPTSTVTEQTEEVAPGTTEELTFTEDEAPTSDTSPTAHPEEYARFKELLKQQAEKNIYDFCPALSVMLNATRDEFAVDAWMEKAADEGYAAAQQYVADRLLSNLPADKLQESGPKKAYALVRKAADAGYDPAKINVYMCMRVGIGVKKDEKGAESYLMEACKSGSPLPRFKWLQLTGRLTDFSDRERPEVKAELDRNNHHVIYFLARLAPDDKTALEWFRKAATAGNPEALYTLSALLSSRNPKQSYELLKTAIELHHAEAMFTLASMLLEQPNNDPIMLATGVRHDDKTGRTIMKTAALNGSHTACYWLGKANYEGKCGFSQNREKAFKHFRNGSILGHPACSLAQGLMLLRGLGVEKDERQGLYYINSAANAGIPQAIAALAYAQYYGYGVSADAAKAAELLQEAAALNYPEAYVFLAYLTEQGGANMKADPKMAARYLRMAEVGLTEEQKTACSKMYDSLKQEGWNPHP